MSVSGKIVIPLVLAGAAGLNSIKVDTLPPLADSVVYTEMPSATDGKLAVVVDQSAPILETEDQDYETSSDTPGMYLLATVDGWEHY